MRVPLPVVLLSCALIIGGLWWKWTQGKDFLAPPSEETLATVRQQAAQPAAAPLRQEATVEKKAVSAESAPPSVEPPLDPGDLVTAPALNAYASEAKKGADHLIRLAKRLEELGSPSRALLAWERVLDFGKGDPIQSTEALKAIRRLRATAPLWNVDPEGSLPLILHVGAIPAMAEKLKPLLPEIARALERASGGIVTVSTDLVVGKKPVSGTESPPSALWLSGGPKEAPATEPVPFLNDGGEREIYSAVFQLVRTKLSRSSAYAAPTAAGSTEDPRGALTCNITRFCWQDFARAMNVIPPAPAAIAPPAPGTKPASGTKPVVGRPVAKPVKPAAKPLVKPVKPGSTKPAPKPKAKPVRDADQE